MARSRETKISVTVLQQDSAKDVDLGFDPDDPPAPLIAALADSIDIDAESAHFRNERTGRSLSDTRTTGEIGLLHGDRIVVGGPTGEPTKAPAAELVSVSPKSRRPVLSLEAGEIVIGRRARGPNAVQLDDETVSGVHATVRASKSGIEVIDHSTTNGTWVNDERIVGSRRLHHGDIVSFGDASTT